ncbi:U6 snRNA phosphodiesterase Usb1 [Phaeosphaeria sp. MPI-PUGE-AT-0046c]|nr:U6 snRNA phosphodiesterase Usb1 [Phaeosphaeria sp. MPI-PUGE-AT-0046c]
MALVQYPDSDSDEPDKTHAIAAQPLHSVSTAARKRKLSDAAQDNLPPLPAAFHDLYTTNARISTSDNPELHGGRKRAAPHVEGNWPSHVYLEWIPSQAESDTLLALIQHVRDALSLQNKARSTKLPLPNIKPFLHSELGAPLPLHVSLSRTLQIKTEDRETFLETLKSCIRKVAVRSFQVNFHSLKWVPNFERNRWFLVLSIEKPAKNELNNLLGACNEAARKCGHPGLYVGGVGDGPMEEESLPEKQHEQTDARRHSERKETDWSDRFHVSIAWNLEEPHDDWVSLVKSMKMGEYVPSLQAFFDAAKARVGNAVHSIDLRTRNTGRVA